MMTQTSYERFPLRITIPVVLINLLLYALGAYILLRIHVAAAILYLGYCAVIHVNVMRRSCRACYYYGKNCAFGIGALCSRLFTRQDPAAFINKDVSALTMIPDFLVVIFPVVGGLISLVFSFSWLYLGVVLAFLFFYLIGTAAVRGMAACKYCRQRELGCPAAQMFARKTREPAPER